MPAIASAWSVRGDRVRLITRGGHDWTSRFLWIVEAARKNRHQRFVIDSEAVVLGVDGVPDFDALHSRRRDDDVQLYAFDILALAAALVPASYPKFSGKIFSARNAPVSPVFGGWCRSRIVGCRRYTGPQSGAARIDAVSRPSFGWRRRSLPGEVLSGNLPARTFSYQHPHPVARDRVARLHVRFLL